MSDFLIDELGNKVWYDLKYDDKDQSKNIDYFISVSEKEKYYVRPHRNNGPAIVWHDGVEEYCFEGLCHRDDGPAVVFASSRIFSWYLNDKSYTFDDWCKELNKSEEEINFLKLKWNIL